MYIRLSKRLNIKGSIVRYSVAQGPNDDKPKIERMGCAQLDKQLKNLDSQRGFFCCK